MIQPKLILSIALFFITLVGCNTVALCSSSNDLDTQREIFIRAEHALKTHDILNYERLSQKIRKYPLYPYLIYEELKQKIQTSKPSEEILKQINQFKKDYPDFPLANTLTNAWLFKMANTNNWSLFIKGYQQCDNQELQCHYLFAKYQLTKDISYLKQAKPLWLVGYSQPKGCDQLFNIWYKEQGLTSSLIWDRFKLALENKNFILIKQLRKHLPSEERLWADQWEKLEKTPHLLSSQSFLNGLTAPEKIKTQMLTQSLRLLAKLDGEKALKWWKTHQHEYAFSALQSQQIQRDIGVYLAHQRSSLAKEWLANLPDNVLDTVAQEWRIRLALADADWNGVLHWINQLSPELKEEKGWQYWQARALEALGKNESLEIYTKLAKTRSYYGFVSSLRLKQPVSLQNQPPPFDPDANQKVANLPAIQRFEQLHLLGKHALARVEWFRAVDKMDEPQIIAAAKIAQRMNLFDIAILTMTKSNFKDDIDLRFPLCLGEDIISNANKHNLDPAWIYAVIRQESAFFNDAISHAGARGLMQLLPSTAQMLATKYDIHYYSENSLHTPEINIQLGTIYLKNLKQRLQNHTILATASYNAGPEHIKRWMPLTPQDADVWIETIPYKETREYVKNVLVFTSIYRQRLGYPSGLILMMKTIPPKSVSNL